MSDHRVKDRQQLSHTSDQGGFRRFACMAQPLVEDADCSITSARNQSSHVECCPHRGPAAPDGPMAPEGPTVTIERRYAHQRGNLFAVELSKFWQLGQKRAANDRTDTGNTSEQIFFFTPDRALTDAAVQIRICSCQFRLQPPDVSINAFSDSPGSCRESVSLGDDHLGELPSASDQRPQLQRNLIRQGTQCRAHRFTKAGQHFGIDTVGLSQLPGSSGKVSDLPRVNHHHGQFSTGQGTDQLAFKPAGGFQHDQRRPDFSQPLDQGLDSRLVVQNRLPLTRGTYSDIQSCFGNIDTDKDGAYFQDSILLDFSFLQHSSTLQIMRALITQATVRAFREAGRDDPCYRTVFNDPGKNDLSRPVSN